MGCVSSTAEETPAAIMKKGVNIQNVKPKPLYDGNASEDIPETVIAQDLRAIMTDCYSVPRPDNLSPLCCLSELSMPFLTVPVEPEQENMPSPFSVPIFATSRLQFGRVLALGSFEFLTKCDPNSQNDVIFLENMLRWAGGPNPPIRTALLYKLGETISQRLVELMTGLGFGLQVQEDGEIDYPKYITIFTTTSLTEPQGLFDFLIRGGCLVCGPPSTDTPNRFALNSVLRRMGIGYWENPPKTKIPETQVCKFTEPYLDLKKQRFPNILDQVGEILDKSEDVPDCLVELLRNHVRLSTQDQALEFCGACDTVFRFLEKMHYRHEQQIVSHETFVLLICEIFEKMTPEQLSEYNMSVPFPGVCNQYTETIEVPIKMKYSGWYSTGLYLPPALVTNVVVKRDIRNLKLLIGCHTQTLAAKPLPWKRWPYVAVSYELRFGSNSIASPFGGVVYLVWEKTVEESAAVSMEILDAVSLPCFVHNRGETWEQTKENLCPFSEIVGKRIIYTLPSETIRSIENLQGFVESVDDIIKTLEEMSGGGRQRPHRVVFDIELPNDSPVCDYPMVFEYSWMPKLLSLSSPSEELFTFFKFVWNLSCGEMIFGDDFANELADAVVSHVFQMKWSGFVGKETAVGKVIGKLEKGDVVRTVSNAMSKARSALRSKSESEKLFFEYLSGKHLAANTKRNS